MESFTDADLIAELQEYYQPIENRAGGVTVDEWAEKQNIGQRMAYDQLKKLMDDGILYRKWQRCGDSRPRYVYYKA